MTGFRKMAALQMSAPLKAVTDNPFPASYSDRVREIGVVNAKNKFLTSVVAKFLDGPAALRRYMIDNFVIEGFTFDQVMTDDEALEAFVTQGGDRRVARLLYLPHGPRRRSDVGRRHPGTGQGRAGPARGRRLDLPDRALRQHQLPDPDDGGEDFRCDSVVLSAAKDLTERSPSLVPGVRSFATLRTTEGRIISCQ